MTDVFPIALLRAMFIGMDPPKHDRLKMLFQAGFTPKRIAAHEPAIRQIVCDVLDRLDGPGTCDLVTDVAQPVVARVIGSFMGIPPEDDAVWANLMNSTLGAGDPDLNPDGVQGAVQKVVPEIFERCRRLIAERRENPTDDLTSVLVHAEVDGEKLEEHEIVMGFFLLVAAGNDSTKATYCSGMRALMEHPEERRALLVHGARGHAADGRVAVRQPAQDAARAAGAVAGSSTVWRCPSRLRRMRRRRPALRSPTWCLAARHPCGWGCSSRRSWTPTGPRSSATSCATTLAGATPTSSGS